MLMGFNNEPASWCFCGGRGPFSTVDKATTNYCNFTTLPTQTISLTSHSTSIDTPPLSTLSKKCSSSSYVNCRLVLFAETGTICPTASVTRPASCDVTPSAVPKPTPPTPPPQPKAYQGGVCSIHIFEEATDGDKGSTLGAEFTIKDSGGKELTKKKIKNGNAELRWGSTITIPKGDSKLDYDVMVTFSTKVQSKRAAREKRIAPGDTGGGNTRPDFGYEKRLVIVQAGTQSWDTNARDNKVTPHFNVGNWDRNGAPPVSS